MNFGQAIAAGFQNYATFTGRARRSAYWYLYLFYIILVIAAQLIGPRDANGTNLLYSLVVLAMLLPMLSCAVRRMHDLDKSGWYILIPIYNIILLATEGTPGPNRFGNPVK